MCGSGRLRAAIVDYGMGNLFSVKHACEFAGMRAEVTADARQLLAADAVVLPRVGALGDAMEALRQRGLVAALREVAASGKPLMGVCLGMQLLMSESHEFGRHAGLGVIEGDVVRLPEARVDGRRVKVPNVGWQPVRAAGAAAGEPVPAWSGSPLATIKNGSFLYFVHSYVTQPADAGLALSTTPFADGEFCSSLARGNVFACQFHPERSGAAGLGIYQAFAAAASRSTAQ